MTRHLCAIHQPNFFPWLGYFDKIRRADVFIFLDDVAYPKSGSGMGSWVNRVRLDIQGSPRWVGCPLQRRHGRPLIREIHIDDTQPWREKLIRTLEMNYRRCSNYTDGMALLRPLIECSESQLSEFNILAIRAIADALKIQATFVRQSELNAIGDSTQLLINLVKSVGATTYLAGDGAAEYQEDELFSLQGVELVFQNFEERTYRSSDNYLPGLSVIDYVMHKPSDLKLREAQ